MNNNSILVIDDEPNNFEVIETLLAGDNYDIYYANSGAEGLAGLDTFNPDVILLDLNMPLMDGLEVCQRLKLMRKWKSVPIIMVTASSRKEVLSECLSAGADDFVHKPVDKVELRARIRSMVRIKKQFDRIESLTKLQQKNITSLEQDLGVLACDLAVGFANELNTPLSVIVRDLGTVEQTIGDLNKAEIINLVKSANRSAMDLEQLTKKFWIYLEIASEKIQSHNNEVCAISKLIKQIAMLHSQTLNRSNDLTIDLENAQIMVASQHSEWIVKELLDNCFKSSPPGFPVKICGQVIDRQFHLSTGYSYPNQIRAEEFTIDEDRFIEHQELGLSLKIVKRIVDIYDGLFSMSTVAAKTAAGDHCYQTTIYITLPIGQKI